MNRGSGGACSDPEEQSERGQNNIVAIVILLGVVAIGAFAIFAVSGTVIDGLQSQMGGEQLESTMGSIDHDVMTAATTGDVRNLPGGGYDDLRVTEEGEIAVAWHNETGDADFDENRFTLGEIEVENTYGTIAHQGGGIWFDTGSEVRIHQEPGIGIDANDSIQLAVTQINRSDELEDNPSRVLGNPDAAGDTLEELNEVVREHKDREKFSIKVESEYAAGWERHFENIASQSDNATVDTDTGDTEAIITVTDIPIPPMLEVKEDHGIVDQQDNTIDDNLLRDNRFRFDGTFENVGGEADEIEVTYTIFEDGDEIPANNHPKEYAASDVASGDIISSQDLTPNEVITTNSLGLEPGTEYEYDIETYPGEDTLTDRGSFIYLNETPDHQVTDISTVKESDEQTIEISADIQNLGESGEQNTTLEVSLAEGEAEAESTEAIDLEPGNESTITWEINETEWPNGEYEFSVGTEARSEKDGAFEVTQGGGFLIEADYGIPADQQAVESDGQVVPGNDGFSIETEIVNTFSDERTQDVTLSVTDGDDGTEVDQDTVSLELDPAENETVEFDVDHEELVSGTTYQYNVSTEDDTFTDPGEFLVLDEADTLDIESAEVADGMEPVRPGDNVDIDVELEDTGLEDETVVWLEGFDGDIVAVSDYHPDEDGDHVTLEWTDMDEPTALDETDVTVRTGTDHENLTLEVEPRAVVTDVSTSGGPVPEGESGSVEVEAELESLGGDIIDEVSLEGDGVDDEQDVAIDAEGTTNVTFEYDATGAERTHRVTVTTATDDGEEDGLVVLERDGPVCSDVEYEVDGDGHYLISNVDELQCINDHGLDENYRLIDDIDAQGTEHWNSGKGFEPIGPTGNQYTTEAGGDDDSNWETFEGDFDGAGFEIEGLHVERPDEEFVGLFGATNYPRDSENTPWGFPARQYDPGEGSTIENVRLADVYVHGERHVGGLVGQAGGTVKDSRSEGTVKAEYQLVGGLVGDGAHADLDNELVAEGTVIGGDYRTPTEVQGGGDYYWNRGIGGLIGRSTWQTDVSTGYTDVEVRGPSMIGGIVGSSSNVRSDFTQMYTVAELEIDSNPGQTERPEYQGAIAGTIENQNDAFRDSVYHDQSPPYATRTYGEEYSTPGGWTGDAIPRETDQMQGLDVTEPGNMDNLDFQEDDDDNPWVAIPDDYPRFAWELEAEGQFDIEIIDVDDDIAGGELLEVDVDVTSNYQDGDAEDVTRNIVLEDPDGNTVDTQSVTLPSTPGEVESTERTLIWQTDPDDHGEGEITVTVEEQEDSESIDIREPDESDDGVGNPGDPLFGDGLSGDSSSDEYSGGPGSSDRDEDEHGPDINVDIDGVAVD